MHEERQKILEMLSARKITIDEADRLLAALEGDLPTEDRPAERPGPGRDEDIPIPADPGWIARILSLLGAGTWYKEEKSQEVDATGASRIHVEAENGEILYDGSEQDKVTVRAWKEIRAPNEEAARAFARQVQIHVKREGDAIHIYKEHPKPPLGTHVAVRYEIQGPSAVSVSLRTVNGRIRVSNVGKAVDAITTNGKVELYDVSGRVEAHASNGKVLALLDRPEERVNLTTSNGAIDVTVRRGAAPITATTSNGSIRLTLPPDFSGKLDAATTNGSVRTDFSVAITEGGRTRLLGQIGEGGDTLVQLRTTNGSIRISKGE
ncbi:MAG: DUF4097 domain-containing protein [Chloroflexi bacterium]|nr:DUF4097 domain-containing protein [Chloroflexota bacterium]